MLKKPDCWNSLFSFDAHRAFILIILVGTLFHGSVLYAEEKILDFPINWNKGAPYNKFLPVNEHGKHGDWSCGKVAYAMIIRYWSLQTPLKNQGTYFYRQKVDNKLLKADYSLIAWDRMERSLAGLEYNDPRVNSVAAFVYMFSLAGRVDWHTPEWGGYYAGRGTREYIGKYFGIDVSDYQRLSFSYYLANHTWSDMFNCIKGEIDAGRPCELVVSRKSGGCHETVITGYRKVDDEFEFIIHFGGAMYDPSKSYRLDRPIEKWDDVLGRKISWGIKPYNDPNRVPLHNKLAEVPIASSETWPLSQIVWNPWENEYGAVFSAGRAGFERLCLQRVSRKGRPIGSLVTVFPSTKGNPQKPVLACGGGHYGVAWEDKSTLENNIFFTILTPQGKKAFSSDILVGRGQPDMWRPTLSLVWNGSEYAIAWREDGQIRFMRISPTGVCISDKKKTLGPGIDPQLVWLGNSYAATWSNSADVFLIRLDKEGNILGDIQQLNSFSGKAAFTPRVAFSGREFGVAWENLTHEGVSVCFCRADVNGKLIPNSQFKVRDEPARVSRAPWLSFHNGEYFLSYIHDAAWLTRISENGEVIENQWVDDGANFLSHALSEDGISIMYLQYLPRYEAIEVENCLVFLKSPAKISSESKTRDSQPIKLAIE